MHWHTFFFFFHHSNEAEIHGMHEIAHYLSGAICLIPKRNFWWLFGSRLCGSKITFGRRQLCLGHTAQLFLRRRSSAQVCSCLSFAWADRESNASFIQRGDVFTTKDPPEHVTTLMECACMASNGVNYTSTHLWVMIVRREMVEEPCTQGSSSRPYNHRQWNQCGWQRDEERR